MKIDRIDVAIDEIRENCEEYLIVSLEDVGDDKCTSRTYVATNGELLKEVIIEEMELNKKFANFILEVANEFTNQ